MKKVLFLMLGLIALAGCAGTSVESVFNSLPQVQSFLAEHPDADIVFTYWTAEEINSSIDYIEVQCEKPMTVQPMYFARMSEADLELFAWFDTAYNPLCIVRKQSFSEEEVEGNVTEQLAKTIPVTDVDLILKYAIEDNCVRLRWTPYPGSDLKYYKVVRSSTNPDPKYPADGYISVITSKLDNTYLDCDYESEVNNYGITMVTSDHGNLYTNPVSPVIITEAYCNDECASLSMEAVNYDYCYGMQGLNSVESAVNYQNFGCYAKYGACSVILRTGEDCAIGMSTQPVQVVNATQAECSSLCAGLSLVANTFDNCTLLRQTGNAIGYSTNCFGTYGACNVLIGTGASCAIGMLTQPVVNATQAECSSLCAGLSVSANNFYYCYTSAAGEGLNNIASADDYRARNCPENYGDCTVILRTGAKCDVGMLTQPVVNATQAECSSLCAGLSLVANTFDNCTLLRQTGNAIGYSTNCFGTYGACNVLIGTGASCAIGSLPAQEVTYDVVLNAQAVEGCVKLIWTPWPEPITYYKIVRSYAKSDPKYPEDGYVGVITEFNRTQYLDCDYEDDEPIKYYRITTVLTDGSKVHSNVVNITQTVFNRLYCFTLCNSLFSTARIYDNCTLLKEYAKINSFLYNKMVEYYEMCLGFGVCNVSLSTGDPCIIDVAQFIQETQVVDDPVKAECGSLCANLSLVANTYDNCTLFKQTTDSINYSTNCFDNYGDCSVILGNRAVCDVGLGS